jgi:hypothetical protein
VAVESGSMVPNMEEGDLVFVMEEHRFAGPGAVEDTGVVPSAVGAETDYRTATATSSCTNRMVERTGSRSSTAPCSG